MPHNSPINPDPQNAANVSPAFYRNGRVLPASFYQALDTAQSNAVNGQTGGSWSPTSTIAIGGAGLWLAGPSQVSGGATIQTPFGSGVRITHAADDTPELAPGHVLSFRYVPTSILASARVIGVTRGFGSVGIVNQGPTSSLQANGLGKRILCPLRVHHGATLSLVELTMTMATHTVAPLLPISWRVYAVDAFGTIIPLNTNLAVVRQGGWLPFPSTAWATSGVHTVFYQTDPLAGVEVDAENFGYMVEILDENGPGAVPGNVFTLLRAFHYDIANMGVQ